MTRIRESTVFILSLSDANPDRCCSFATVNAVQQTIKAPPALIVTLGRKVLPKTTGFISA
jgi:hypothetical protein